jgi:hypothetical protein
MAASLELNPGERVLADTTRCMLQGKRIKFIVWSRCVVTDQRFIWFDLGKMAAWHLQLGFLLKMLVKGRPVSMPLHGLVLSRGRYAMNTKLLSLRTPDGSEVLLDRYGKSLEWLQNVLAENGMSMSQTGEEEWTINI